MNRKHLTSSTAPGNGVTAPLRIVLHESHVSTKEHIEWVTHLENMQDGSKFSGHYFRCDSYPIAAYSDALESYVLSCRELGVDPMPEQADEAPSKLLKALQQTLCYLEADSDDEQERLDYAEAKTAIAKATNPKGWDNV